MPVVWTPLRGECPRSAGRGLNTPSGALRPRYTHSYASTLTPAVLGGFAGGRAGGNTVSVRPCNPSSCRLMQCTPLLCEFQHESRARVTWKFPGRGSGTCNCKDTINAHRGFHTRDNVFFHQILFSNFFPINFFNPYFSTNFFSKIFFRKIFCKHIFL